MWSGNQKQSDSLLWLVCGPSCSERRLGFYVHVFPRPCLMDKASHPPTQREPAPLSTELYFQGEQCGVGEGMCAALLDAFPQTRQEGDCSRDVGGPCKPGGGCHHVAGDVPWFSPCGRRLAGGRSRKKAPKMAVFIQLEVSACSRPSTLNETTRLSCNISKMAGHQARQHSGTRAASWTLRMCKSWNHRRKGTNTSALSVL